MSKPRILIVDDDPDLLHGLGVRLRATGFDVIAARDTIEAVIAVRREQPDLVVLDLGLPAGDGYVAMERFKANRLSATVPVIVLSARDPEPNREQSLRHGAFAYFHKPVHHKILVATIRKALGLDEVALRKTA
jgi:DNA-binding response OmpR family regulator